MSLRFATLFPLVLTAWHAPPAGAADPWSPPAPLPEAGDTARVAFAPGGRGLVTWRIETGTSAAASTPQGTFPAVTFRRRGLFTTEVGAYGDDAVLLAGFEHVRGGRDPRYDMIETSRPAVALGRIDGRLGPTRVLASRRWRGVVTDVAVNARGDAVIGLALQRRGRGKDAPLANARPYVVLRRAGRLSRPMRLSRRPLAQNINTRPIGSLTVAIDERGRALAAFSPEQPVTSRSRHDIIVRRGTVRSGLRETRTLRAIERPISNLSAGFGAGGEAAVAWVAQQVYDYWEWPRSVGVAVVRADGRVARHTLERAGARQLTLSAADDAGVRVLGRSSGRPEVAWSGQSGVRRLVRFAAIREDATPDRVHLLGDPAEHAWLYDATVDRTGRVAVLSATGESRVEADGWVVETASSASLRAPGATDFAAPERFAAFDPSRGPDEVTPFGSVAIDLRSGRTVAVASGKPVTLSAAARVPSVAVRLPL